MRLFSVTLCALWAMVSQAQATVLFMDDFTAYGPVNQTNAADSVFLGNWQTTGGGTVDYIGPNDPSNGYCPSGCSTVDLDGGTAGMTAVFSTVMTFGAGVYDVLFQLAGSGVGTAETVTISFGSIVRTIVLGSAQVAHQGDFGSDFFGIRVGAGGATLSFSNAGSDGSGVHVKSVVIQTAEVPLPATGGLLVLGLGVLAYFQRRKMQAIG